MYEILNEDQYNDTYGRYRMYNALKLKHQDDSDFYILDFIFLAKEPFIV